MTFYTKCDDLHDVYLYWFKTFFKNKNQWNLYNSLKYERMINIDEILKINDFGTGNHENPNVFDWVL